MRVAVVDVALHLLHLGKHRIEVKFRLGRELGNELVHGDFALGAAGNVVGIERLAVDFLAFLLNKPKGFLHGFARGSTRADSADFLGRKNPSDIGFAVGIVLRRMGGFVSHAVPQCCV